MLLVRNTGRVWGLGLSGRMNSVPVQAMIRSFAKSSKQPQQEARLVSTHSTYVQGLKPCLSALKSLHKLSTIVPGRLAQRKVRRDASRALVLRFSKAQEDREHEKSPLSFKILASRGTQIQELFLVVRWEHKDLSVHVLAEDMRRVLPSGVQVEGDGGHQNGLDDDEEDDEDEWSL
jgi:hypothetical protein